MGIYSGITVVMGVTGGIAVYKSCMVVSALKKQGASVHVIMTKNACEFVAPLTFQTLSSNPVVTDTFATPEKWDVEHVALAKAADLLLICPATANIMAKMAHGIADDMLSTTVLATKAPVLIAPAMNTGMWDNPATQENLKILKNRGMHFVGPAGGLLACGDTGMGRMSEPDEILDACQQILCAKQDLDGLKVLVTAGPTREKIDPVRFMTNRSSGKMGYAIAEAAQMRGAQVTLVSGPVSIAKPASVRVVDVESTNDLYHAMCQLAPEFDIVIQAAAPADFTPKQVANQKIKKNGDEELVMEFVQTPDVAGAVGKNKKPGQTFVGFAAETEHLNENAQKKLEKKHLDLICANDVTKPGAGFDVDTNIITLIDHDGTAEYPMMSKRQAADVILDKIVSLRK